MNDSFLDDTFAEARQRMVQGQLRARGIENEAVLDAMASVPRERFLPPDRQRHAYEDRALPLGEAQTMSQPFMVAAMTAALEPRPSDRVLEIGTGSGYQAAVLAELVERVYTVERLESLSASARRVLDEMGVDNVEFLVGDGTRGWPEYAPFDGIVVTAGAPAAPNSLKKQLSEDGGRLVVPEGSRHMQDLVHYRRRGGDFERNRLMSCRFVPLVGQEGWQPDVSA